MTNRLTTYFQQRHAWTPDWRRIKLVPNGWYLPLSSRLCGVPVVAAVIATLRGYEIHHVPGVAEREICHELWHIYDMERMGRIKYVLSYAAELMRVGYKRNKHEISARQCAADYEEWKGTQ